MELALQGLDLTHNSILISDSSGKSSLPSIRFRMTEHGEIVIVEREAKGDVGGTALQILEAVLDSLPRLPATEIREGDSWVGLSDLSTGLTANSGIDPGRVEYRCTVKDIPLLFGGVALSLSSTFDGEMGAGQSRAHISGKGNGSLVFRDDDCTIERMEHRTRAIISWPDIGNNGSNRTSIYNMDLSLILRD